MADAGTVLDIARGELGETEHPPGSNQCKYSDWYPMPGEPWCGMYVSWVADRAGATSLIPKYAYTPDGAQWFKDRGLWVTSGYKPGDVTFYQWPDSDRICHTGFCESWDGHTLTAIEGNTDVSGGGSGGQVMRQYRTKYIRGAGRPGYDEGSTTVASYWCQVQQNTGQEVGPDAEDIRMQDDVDDEMNWHDETNNYPSIAPDRRIAGNAVGQCLVEGAASVRLRTYSTAGDYMQTVAAQDTNGGNVNLTGYCALSDGHKLRLNVDPLGADPVTVRYASLSLAARDA